METLSSSVILFTALLISCSPVILLYYCVLFYPTVLVFYCSNITIHLVFCSLGLFAVVRENPDFYSHVIQFYFDLLYYCYTALLLCTLLFECYSLLIQGDLKRLSIVIRLWQIEKCQTENIYKKNHMSILGGLIF